MKELLKQGNNLSQRVKTRLNNTVRPGQQAGKTEPYLVLYEFSRKPCLCFRLERRYQQALPSDSLTEAHLKTKSDKLRKHKVEAAAQLKAAPHGSIYSAVHTSAGAHGNTRAAEQLPLTCISTPRPPPLPNRALYREEAFSPPFPQPKALSAINFFDEIPPDPSQSPPLANSSGLLGLPFDHEPD